MARTIRPYSLEDGLYGMLEAWITEWKESGQHVGNEGLSEDIQRDTGATDDPDGKRETRAA